MEYYKSLPGNIGKWSKIYPNVRFLAKNILVIIMYIIYGISCRLLVESRKKNTDALVVASKESGLEVKTKYMVFFWHQDAGQSHNIKTDNSSFERIHIFGNNLNKSQLYSGRN